MNIEERKLLVYAAYSGLFFVSLAGMILVFDNLYKSLQGLDKIIKTNSEAIPVNILLLLFGLMITGLGEVLVISISVIYWDHKSKATNGELKCSRVLIDQKN